MFEIVRLPNSTAIVLLIVSFFAGVIIDILYLKKMTMDFYRASVTLMIPLYVILSLIAIALCMGVPIGNIVLGILICSPNRASDMGEKLARILGLRSYLVTTRVD